MTHRCCALLIALLLAGAASTARADTRHGSPDAAGWWQTGAVALITSAGLEEGELLVDGVGRDDASRQAVAGLSFAIDPGSSLGVVTVRIVSTSVPAPVVGVCAVTEAFDSVHGGPGGDVPAHDCSRTATAVVDQDDNLVIDDLADLRDGQHLRILLVPAQPGRIVLDGASAVLATAPPSATPTTAPAVTSQPAATPLEPVGTAGAALSDGTSLQPTGSSTGLPSRPGKPEVAVSAAAPASFPGFSPRPDDHGLRLVVATTLTVALGAFTVLNRGGAARLRPSALPWRPPPPRADGPGS